MAYVLDRKSAAFAERATWPSRLPGLADAPAPFGGDPALQQWARDLATTWAKRLKSKPDEQQREVKKKEEWLDQDMKVTLAAADKRARRTGKKYGTPAILQAWRISREQQMDFETWNARRACQRRSDHRPTRFRASRLPWSKKARRSP